MFLLRVIDTSPPENSPPLLEGRKGGVVLLGGRGGLKGIASTLGRCDNSAEDSRPGTAHQAVVTRGYPPCPPFSRGRRRATESG